jgi:cytoplasmic FMR1 interacting protein
MSAPSTVVASSGDIKSGEENIEYLPQVLKLEAGLNGAALQALLTKASVTGGAASISSAANITAPSYALDYDLGSLEIGDYRDRLAFPASQFTEETMALEQLNALLIQGQEYIAMLYTYRSCSKAIPMVQGDTPDETKILIHKQTFNILRPQILKLKEFMEFHEKAVGVIRVNVLLVQKADAAKSVQSEPLLDLLIDAIDMLVLLDALKDMRAALQNDFSRYKRAFTPIRGELADSDRLSDEIHTLQMFLSNPQQAHNLIMSHLKTDVHKVAHFEVVISLLINHAMDCIETGTYLTPNELHAYYRVLPHLLYLVDSDDQKGGHNVFKLGSSDKIKFSLSRMQKLFKSFPIIPLYADMHIDVMFVLRRCKHWEEESMKEAWQTNRPQKLKERYELIYQRAKIRADYNDFTARFTTLLNEIQAFTAAKRIITPKMLQTVFASVLEGLKLLSSWSARIEEQSAYKYSKPKSDAEFAALGGKSVGPDGKPIPGIEYVKAVHANYTAEELYALIDVIGMLKGLGGLMIESQLIHEPLVRRCIHDDTQIFLQQELARPLRKAHKKNKKVRQSSTMTTALAAIPRPSSLRCFLLAK